ncbi:hypothetical protein D9757_006066 [Collybiopsis confluens]|uniref:DUF6534 domain-containing protein n=1 Tax=Collybiopsis confluens TaxID=2823264 RepID=A0A8H5HUG5_9AGAR|nr:hypothetical protein D9757_006066 [Collybiopsis confluens]
MDSIPGTPKIPALDNTFGALLIGSMVGAALWGVGTLQLYYYFYHYPKDRAWLKILVLIAWTFDTVQQALIGHVVYYYLVQNYFNPANLDHYIWSQKYQSLFESLTSFCVQSFFIFRIFKLSKGNLALCGVAMVLTLGKLGVGLVYFGRSVKIESITLAFQQTHGISEAINGATAGSDITITLILCWLLFNSRSTVQQTNMVINKLIVYSINTGALTSFCAILTLILAKTMPTNFIYGAFYYLIARLYINSMLATLNARSSLAKNLGSVVVGGSSAKSPNRSGQSNDTSETAIHFRDPNVITLTEVNAEGKHSLV